MDLPGGPAHGRPVGCGPGGLRRGPRRPVGEEDRAAGLARPQARWRQRRRGAQRERGRADVRAARRHRADHGRAPGRRQPSAGSPAPPIRRPRATHRSPTGLRRPRRAGPACRAPAAGRDLRRTPDACRRHVLGSGHRGCRMPTSPTSSRTVCGRLVPRASTCCCATRRRCPRSCARSWPRCAGCSTAAGSSCSHPPGWRDRSRRVRGLGERPGSPTSWSRCCRPSGALPRVPVAPRRPDGHSIAGGERGPPPSPCRGDGAGDWPTCSSAARPPTSPTSRPSAGRPSQSPGSAVFPFEVPGDTRRCWPRSSRPCRPSMAPRLGTAPPRAFRRSQRGSVRTPTEADLPALGGLARRAEGSVIDA